jgi:hypothetical protein
MSAFRRGPNPGSRPHGRRPRKGYLLQVERLEDRTLPAGSTLATAAPIPPTGVIAETIGSPGQADFF